MYNGIFDFRFQTAFRLPQEAGEAAGEPDRDDQPHLLTAAPLVAWALCTDRELGGEHRPVLRAAPHRL